LPGAWRPEFPLPLWVCLHLDSQSSSASWQVGGWTRQTSVKLRSLTEVCLVG